MRKIIIRCLLLIMILPFILIGCQNNAEDPNKKAFEDAVSNVNSIISKMGEGNFTYLSDDTYLFDGDKLNKNGDYYLSVENVTYKYFYEDIFWQRETTDLNIGEEKSKVLSEFDIAWAELKDGALLGAQKDGDEVSVIINGNNLTMQIGDKTIEAKDIGSTIVEIPEILDHLEEDDLEEKETILRFFDYYIDRVLNEKNFGFDIGEAMLPMGDLTVIESIDFDGNKFGERYSQIVEYVDGKSYIYTRRVDEEISDWRYYKDNYEGVDLFQYIKDFVYVLKNNVEWGKVEDGTTNTDYIRRGLKGKITDWGGFEFRDAELTSGISNEFQLFIQQYGPYEDEYFLTLVFESENHKGPINIHFAYFGLMSLKIPTEFVDRT